MAVNAYATLVARTINAGSIIDFNQAVNTISFEIIPNGTITAGAVTLQISPDGVNWFAPPTANVVSQSGATAANPYTLVTGTNALFTVANCACRFARVLISTTVTGGTVSAFISGAGS